jgi:hypothetical protein
MEDPLFGLEKTPRGLVTKKSTPTTLSGLHQSVMLPLVTVIITNFNYARYVAEALRSVAAQTYPRVECVIVDDCSTDNSREEIERTLASIDRPEFSAIFLERNVGQLGAMSAGLKKSTGVFVNFLDADDMLISDFISSHIRAHLNSAFSSAVTASDTIQIDDDGQILEGTLHFMWKRRGEPLADGHSDDLSKAARVIPTSAIPDLDIEDAATRRGIDDPLHYIVREFRGWPVVASSSFVFRRNVALLSIPRDTGPARICADYYLYTIAHAVGGTICIPTAHSFYRFHTRNSWTVFPVVGGPYKTGTLDPATTRRLDNLIARHFLGDIETWTRLVGPARFAAIVENGMFSSDAD